MKYVEFKELIRRELTSHPSGLTWAELKHNLDLPYKRPCPTWTRNLEAEIGLVRQKGTQRAYVWTLAQSEES